MEDGLYALVCFKNFQIIRKFLFNILTVVYVPFLFAEAVLVLLSGLLKEALWFANLVLKVLSVRPT